MAVTRLAKLSQLIWISLALGGCSHHGPQVLPEPYTTVADVYHYQMAHSGMDLMSLRAALSLSDDRLQQKFRENFSGSGYQGGDNFKKVRNPEISIYVYPHLVRAGSSEVMIPGYTTQFSLYEGNHYALPGERTE